MNIYIIDTSSLIEMKNRYPKKNFPRLWEKVEELISKNRLISPLEVRKEIERGDDELSKWVKNKKINRMFIKPDSLQMEKAKEIINKYDLAQVEKPDNLNADPYLIALALVKKERSKKELVEMKLFDKDNVNIDYIIITEESTKPKKIPSIGSKESKKIPSICKDLGINCIKLLKMIDLESWSF
jgi:hypothetical protein